MCLSVPGKIKSIKDHIYTIDYGPEQRKVLNSLISVKRGDWVFVQQKTIVRRIPARQAQEILSLIK